MSYYKVCPHCGAHLDPGESCDCIGSLYASLSPEDRQTVDEKIAELLQKKKAALDAANIQGGGVEQDLTGTDSASTITENGGFVK